jgi:hypothetical protein
VDFLALLADCAAAARVVGAPPQGATVEPVLELLAVLGFPCLDWQAVLLLDLVPVPLWDDVEAAEGDDPQVGGEVVDVAPLEPLLVLIADYLSSIRYINSSGSRLMSAAILRRRVRSISSR